MAESTSQPDTASPTTVSMNLVSDTDDGGGMAEVIRSDGKQVYHTVNVNVNGVVKNMMVPVGESPNPPPSNSNVSSALSKSETIGASSTMTSTPAMPTNGSDGKLAVTVSSITSTASSFPLTVPTAAGPRRIVIASPSRPNSMLLPANSMLNAQKRPTKTVSILPATARMPFPVIRPAVPNQSGKQTFVLVPKTQGMPSVRASLPQVVMPGSQYKGVQTVIPLAGGKFAVSKNTLQTTSAGKPMITLVPQGQAVKPSGTPIVVTPRPNISLPPGFALVPVSSSNALKPSDVLNIPTSNKSPLDNQALSDLLKSIAQQTVNNKKTEVKPPVTLSIPVKMTPSAVPGTPANVSAMTAMTTSMAPPPLKVLPFSVSSTGLVMPTCSTMSNPSSKAIVQLATASVEAKAPMSEIKIDSVYSLNEQEVISPLQRPESCKNLLQDGKENSEKEKQTTDSPGKESDDKNNGDTDKSDFKDNFVVLAEWAKESEEEDDFDDTDVDSDCNDQKHQQDSKNDHDAASDKESDINDNDSVDIETVKDDEAITKKEQASEVAVSTGADVVKDVVRENQPYDEGHQGDDEAEEDDDDDKDSQSTEIADLGAVEAELSQFEKESVPKQNAIKENKAPETTETKSKAGEEQRMSGAQGDGEKGDGCRSADTVDKAKVPEELLTAKSREMGTADGHFPVKVKEEQSPDVKKEETKVKFIVLPMPKKRQTSSSPGRADSVAKKIRHRKRKLKMSMKLMYWKREHKYMFDCKVLLPKLHGLKSTVDLTTFKPPVIPEHILQKVRYVGDPNWTDILIDRVPNRQHRRRRSEVKTENENSGTNEVKEKLKRKVKQFVDKKATQDDVFIVQTVNGESKLVKMPSPEKRAYLKSIAPKLPTTSTSSISTPTSSTAGTTSVGNVAKVMNVPTGSSAQSLLTAAKLAAGASNAATLSSATSLPGPPKVIIASNARNKLPHVPVIAKARMVMPQIAKPTSLGTRTVIALPSASQGGTGVKTVVPTGKRMPVSLMPIAPATKKMTESIPVTVGGTSVSVPVSMLVQAQAMGCKLAFQVPTSTSSLKAPRPLFISPTAFGKKPGLMSKSSTAPMAPCLISTTASGTATKALQVPVSPSLSSSEAVKPLVIAPISSNETPQATATTVTIPQTSVAPIVIKPAVSLISPPSTFSVSTSSTMATSTVTSSLSTAVTTVSIAGTPTSPRGGNQRYLVLNTSSGKMIMPMPAALSGATTVPGKSILNIPSVVPKTFPASSSTAVTTAPPVFVMSQSSMSSSSGSPMKSVMLHAGNQRFPMIIKRADPNAVRGATPRAVFTVKPTSTPTLTPQPMNAQTITVQKPSEPKQRSPAARQNRMIQRLSEFMSPAAAAALAASVPAEPIEITPQPIKIEPDDSADFNFPIQIKEEPRTEGYGDEDGTSGPSLANVQIKDEPPSSDSDSESDEASREPPAKHPKLDDSVNHTNGSSEISPVPKSMDAPPTHDARSRIDELREKLRKAMADVDEIRQKRHVAAQSMDES